MGVGELSRSLRLVKDPRNNDRQFILRLIFAIIDE